MSWTCEGLKHLTNIRFCTPNSLSRLLCKFILFSTDIQMLQHIYWRHLVKSVEFNFCSSCKIWPVDSVKEQEKMIQEDIYFMSRSSNANWILHRDYQWNVKNLWINLWPHYTSFLYPIVLIWLIIWLQEPNPQLL